MASRATTSRLLRHIPDGNPKHAIEMIENISAPLFVPMDDYLRVGIRAKLMSACLAVLLAVPCNCKSRR